MAAKPTGFSNGSRFTKLGSSNPESGLARPMQEPPVNAVLTYHSRDAGILALALAPTMCRESPAAGKGFIQPTRRSLLPRLRVTGTSIETCTCAWGMLTSAASGMAHGRPRAPSDSAFEILSRKRLDGAPCCSVACLLHNSQDTSVWLAGVHQSDVRWINFQP